MNASETVGLERVGREHEPLLSVLLDLYIHDLSEVFAVKRGPDGRFGYEKLPLYWSEPETHYAFLIKAGDDVAGFALVTRGSPATTDPNDFDVAEFFVLRGYRRLGVGQRGASALWDNLPGNWVVRVSEANHGGLAFWNQVIRTYADGSATELTQPGSPHPWRVFRFASRAGTLGAV
jgi:predicted acetyltransferase